MCGDHQGVCGRPRSVSEIAALIPIPRAGLNLSTTVVDPDDGDGAVADFEKDCYSSTETDCAQSRSQIIADRSTNGKRPEPLTVIEDGIDIVGCSAGG